MRNTLASGQAVYKSTQSAYAAALFLFLPRQDAGAEWTGQISHSARSVTGWNMIPPVCPESLREVSRSSQQNSLEVRLPEEPSQDVWTDWAEQTTALGAKGDVLFGIIEQAAVFGDPA